MAPSPTSSTVALTLAFCFMGSLCEGFDVQAAGVAAAGLRLELRPTASELGLFFSASGAGLLLGALVLGRVADRVGRRPVLIASIAAFGVFSLVTPFARTMPELTAARLLTGLGLGGAMPNLIATAADTGRATARNTSIALTYVGMPLGGALASGVVWSLPPAAWRLIFQIGGVAPLGMVPLMILFMPHGPATTSAASAVDARAVVRVLFGDGRWPATLLSWASFFLIVLSLHLMLNWLPLLMVGRGMTKDEAALAQLAFNVGGAALSSWMGSVLDSPHRRVGVGVALMGLPAVVLLLAVAPPRASVLMSAAFLLGGGLLAQQVVAFGGAAASYPGARGTGLGASVAAGRLGSLAGPLFAAYLLAAGRSPVQVLLGVLPLSIVCSACVAWLFQRTTTRGARLAASLEPREHEVGRK